MPLLAQLQASVDEPCFDDISGNFVVPEVSDEQRNSEDTCAEKPRPSSIKYGKSQDKLNAGFPVSSSVTFRRSFERNFEKSVRTSSEEALANFIDLEDEVGIECPRRSVTCRDMSMLEHGLFKMQQPFPATVRNSSLRGEWDPNNGLRQDSSVVSRHALVEETFQKACLLGAGSFGVVHKVVRREDGHIFALKSVAADDVRDKERFDRELTIARKLNNPFIAKLTDIFKDHSSYHLILEMCYGPTLSSKMVPDNMGRNFGGFFEKTYAVYIRQILAGIAYIHHYGIVHRDIKPDNVMLSTQNLRSDIKIVDFGLSRLIPEGQEPMVTMCGTPVYMAPEILRGKGYNCRCDIWSLGITMYYMVTGDVPFRGKLKDVIHRVSRGYVDFCIPCWDEKPSSVRDLVRQLLHNSPETRVRAQEVNRENEWLRSYPLYFRSSANACCTTS